MKEGHFTCREAEAIPCCQSIKQYHLAMAFSNSHLSTHFSFND